MKDEVYEFIVQTKHVVNKCGVSVEELKEMAALLSRKTVSIDVEFRLSEILDYLVSKE